jgi:hypothetical protein
LVDFIGDLPIARIVSQGHDKVFTAKMARKRFFRPRFARNQLTWDDHCVLNDFAIGDRHTIGEYGSVYLCTRSKFHVVPKD